MVHKLHVIRDKHNENQNTKGPVSTTKWLEMSWQKTLIARAIAEPIYEFRSSPLYFTLDQCKTPTNPSFLFFLLFLPINAAVMMLNFLQSQSDKEINRYEGPARV